MERQEMIELLSYAESYIIMKPAITDAARLHIAEVREALRTERAEPVAVVGRDGSLGWLADWIDSPRHQYLPAGTMLYTAPPPDHAEALAEALERLDDAIDAIGDDSDDFAKKWHFMQEKQEVARAALTRYKESRNG